MDKQEQDKLWNELSEESKSIVKNAFGNIDSALNGKCIDAEGMKHFMNTLFGSHNLNPEPQIKTWEDVEKEHPEYRHDISDLSKIACVDMRILCKLIATYKIAKLIELGYGGMVSEEEALDDNVEKSAIDLYDGKIHLQTGICASWGDRFLMFRSNELGEEFMSHESNRKLVEQYYMM